MQSTLRQLSKAFVVELLKTSFNMSDARSCAEEFRFLFAKYLKKGLNVNNNISELYEEFFALNDSSLYHVNIKLFFGFKYAQEHEFIDHFELIKKNDYNLKLYFASILNRADSIRARLSKNPLLVNQIYPVLKSRQGRSFLYFATANNNTEACKTLLAYNPDINLAIKYGPHAGGTALYNACERNNTEIAKLLLERKANVNAAITGSACEGVTPLITAIFNENVELVEQLLKHGANPNARQGDIRALPYWGRGLTALHLACSISPKQSLRISNLLIQSGADVTIKTSLGVTPLWIAVNNNNSTVVDALLRTKIDINYRIPITKRIENRVDGKTYFANYFEGETAFWRACYTGKFSLAQMLLQYGADPKVKPENMASAFWYVFRKGNTKLAELLLKHGADINSKNEYGETALVNAASFNKIAVVKFLLSNNASPNIIDANRRTAFSYACCHDNEEMLLLFMQYGAKIPESIQKFPWLHRAIGFKSKTVAKLLILLGAKDDELDKEQKKIYSELVKDINSAFNFKKLYDFQAAYSLPSEITAHILGFAIKDYIGFLPSSILCSRILENISSKELNSKTTSRCLIM